MVIVYIIATIFEVLVLVENELYIKDRLSKAIARTANFNNIMNLKDLVS